MEMEEWGVLSLIALVSLAAIAAMTVPTQNFLVARHPSDASPTQSPSFTSTPHPPPQYTPTPRRTPTSTPTPQPSVSPTPPPMPTPTPTPVPAWVAKGFKCEVPDALVNELWAQTYKWECSCLVRGRWDLGDRFNVFEGCFSSVSSGWRRESCECVDVICHDAPRLC